MQFGGQSINGFDEILAPYLKKSYDKYLEIFEDEVNKESTEEPKEPIKEPVDEIESETESVSTKESNDENNSTDSSSLDPTIQKAFMDASLGDFTKSLEQKIIAIVTDIM